jgi:hypothetical protein
MPEAQEKRWSPFRFRLITLVWLTLVVAITLGWWSERTRAITLTRELRSQELKFELERTEQMHVLSALRTQRKRREHDTQIWYQKRLLKLLSIPEELELRPVVQHVKLDPTVENLDVIKHFQSIISLTFTRGDLSYEEGARIYEMPQLEMISFHNVNVPIKTLKILGNVPHIQRLRLSGADIDDEKLAILGQNSRLRSLELSHNRAITDAGILSLSKRTQLEELEIHATNVTNAGLDHLESMTRLKRVRIDQTKTTIAGREKLSRALPDCRISLEHVGSLRIGW